MAVSTCLTLQSGSDYGPYLANEASPLHTTTIVERCTEKLVDDWTRMRANVSYGLSTVPVQPLHIWPYYKSFVCTMSVVSVVTKDMSAVA